MCISDSPKLNIKSVFDLRFGLKCTIFDLSIFNFIFHLKHQVFIVSNICCK